MPTETGATGTHPMANGAGALAGLRVIELTHAWAGPFCGMMLADMGADVIKVENPGQHHESRGGAPYIGNESLIFIMTHRNKRSLTLDLKDPRGKEAFLKLVETADILVQNFRPGALKKIGLGYDDLSRINPRLVYCSISGFGQTGPYRHLGGVDIIAQAMSGFLSITGEPGGGPCFVGVPICDMGTAMFACYGILSACAEREESGLGQHVDACLMDTPTAWLVAATASYQLTGQVPDPATSRRNNVPAGSYQTKNGDYVSVFATYPTLWGDFCRALNLGHLENDPRFATRAKRAENGDELQGVLHQLFQGLTSEEALTALRREGIPCGPVNTVDRMVVDPHILARDMVVEQDHPTAGKVHVMGVPVKLSETPARVRTVAPLLGQHTAEILSSLGYSSQELKGLREARVI